MKKVLIPILGLLVLIILTPFILSNIMNSNIDKKIAKFKSEGIKITETKKDISYLTSKRVFEVELNQNTKLPAFKAQKFIKKLDFKVILTFKNLPITKANFDVLGNNFKLHLVTKDMKNFNVLATSKFFDKLTGEYHKNKFDTFSFNIDKAYFKNYKSDNLKISGEIKDLALYLVNLKLKGDLFEAKNLKIVNFKYNLATHLKPDNKYNINENFYADKLGVKIANQKIVFGDFNETDNLVNLDINKKSTDGNVTIKFDKTEYKTIVGGGEIKAVFKNLNPSLKNTYLVLDAKLDKDLLNKISSNFDPEEVKKYFKNNQTHIEIKDNKVFINGNRIQ